MASIPEVRIQAFIAPLDQTDHTLAHPIEMNETESEMVTQTTATNRPLIAALPHTEGIRQEEGKAMIGVVDLLQEIITTSVVHRLHRALGCLLTTALSSRLVMI